MLQGLKLFFETLALGVSPRDTIPFDYAFRFQIKPHPAPAPAPPPGSLPNCSAFNRTEGATCSGLKKSVSGSANADACKAACCQSIGCTVWQYALNTNVSSDRCWIGTCIDHLQGKSPSWASGAVPAPPPPPTPSPPPPPGPPGPHICGVECSAGYNDSTWELIDAPHDYIVTLPITNASTNNEASGFFPRANAIYRKHFVLPIDWKDDYVYLRFEGVYKVAYIYLNSEFVMAYGGNPGSGSSDSAYTDFEVRLDNHTSTTYGTAAPNTLAIYVDGSYGTEHWYAGAGLYRSVHLVRTSKVHLDAGSLYFVATPDTSKLVRTRLPSNINDGQDPEIFSFSAPATVASTVTVVNDGTAGSSSVDVTVTLRVFDSTNALVAEAAVGVDGIAAGGGTTLHTADLRIAQASLWSVQTPHLYTLVSSVADTHSGRVLDTANTTIGVRSARWDVKRGFFLNTRNVKLRGFCHHDDFTAVGMAVPDRVWLLRIMQSRGMGANALRTSHNNYRGGVYDIADAAGVLVYDENRDLKEAGLQAMAKMLRAHRNHPSIVAYSLCNEGECNDGGPADPKGGPGNRWRHNRTVFAQFRNLTRRLDPSRAISGNMWSEFGPGTLTDFLDVQGISHPNAAEIASIRQLQQQRPLLRSECCSCQSERGEDQGTVDSGGYPSHGLAGKSYPGFNGDCLQRVVGLTDTATDSLPYVAGSMVWTLGDYIGEALVWPAVSSSFGAVDLAGFPKAGARWFQAWWLQSASPLSAASRPPLPTAASLHIVESNEPRSSDPHTHTNAGAEQHNQSPRAAPTYATNATFHVYSSAKSVELFVNGASMGARSNAEWMGWTEWNTTWVSGNVTAVAKNTRGEVVATHSRVTAGAAATILLQLDAPSPMTATGRRVLLDGHDVALLRATIVDARGQIVPTSVANITFEVVSGPGRVLGVGNGDPQCKLPHQVRWRPAFHGLSRAVIKVTEDASRSDRTSQLIRAIDVESGLSAVKVHDPMNSSSHPLEPIVVQASAPGLVPGTIAVPVSRSFSLDGVLASARASLTSAVSLD